MVTPLEAAGAVVDPELRVVTIDELGILRSSKPTTRPGRSS
jgi:ring-1,2-phenylacetyl-CoA epoxidase subunit PaaD